MGISAITMAASIVTREVSSVNITLSSNNLSMRARQQRGLSTLSRISRRVKSRPCADLLDWFLLGQVSTSAIVDGKRKDLTSLNK
jgi:hypothetical protein